MKLSSCNNISDLRGMARRRLPAPVFHYLDGGADDEWSLARNSTAFDSYELMPAQLKDVRSIDLSTRLLGTTQALPIMLSPTGMSRLFHRDKELAVARAAGVFGVTYALSTMSTTTIEDVAANANGPKMFQVYVFKDRGLTQEFVQRCKAAGYQALCLTVDTPVFGNRERDLVNGMTIPPRIGLKQLQHYLSRPGWSCDAILRRDFQLANIAQRTDLGELGTFRLIDFLNRQFDRCVTWDDVAWLRGIWDGPLVIKGVLTPDDAQRSVDAGATALMISNHGGRQLDAVAAPVSCVSQIRSRVGEAVELIVDGGIRRGTHVLKALALGASACSIGRPYLYGLAAGGQAGVERALGLLQEELLRGMALLGCRDINEVTIDRVRAVRGRND